MSASCWRDSSSGSSHFSSSHSTPGAIAPATWSSSTVVVTLSSSTSRNATTATGTPASRPAAARSSELLDVVAETVQLVAELAVLGALVVGLVAHVVDAGIETVHDRLVDDGRAHDDAQSEGEEDRDERDQVEAEVDHGAEKSLSRHLVEAGFKVIRSLKVINRSPAGTFGFRWGNQMRSLIERHRSSRVRRRPSMNT